MKKIVLSIILCVMTFAAIAQDNNTIKFRGIPIDGNKKEMISKLQAKGYKYDAASDALFGEFNVTNAVISVQTVNNRVWRIAIVDPNMNSDEANIKIRYNRIFQITFYSTKYSTNRASR